MIFGDENISEHSAEKESDEYFSDKSETNPETDEMHRKKTEFQSQGFWENNLFLCPANIISQTLNNQDVKNKKMSNVIYKKEKTMTPEARAIYLLKIGKTGQFAFFRKRCEETLNGLGSVSPLGSLPGKWD